MESINTQKATDGGNPFNVTLLCFCYDWEKSVRSVGRQFYQAISKLGTTTSLLAKVYNFKIQIAQKGWSCWLQFSSSAIWQQSPSWTGVRLHAALTPPTWQKSCVSPAGAGVALPQAPSATLRETRKMWIAMSILPESGTSGVEKHTCLQGFQMKDYGPLLASDGGNWRQKERKQWDSKGHSFRSTSGCMWSPQGKHISQEAVHTGTVMYQLWQEGIFGKPCSMLQPKSDLSNRAGCLATTM